MRVAHTGHPEGEKEQQVRLIRFIANCIRLRSVSRARWVDAYDNHKPAHGK